MQHRNKTSRMVKSLRLSLLVTAICFGPAYVYAASIDIPAQPLDKALNALAHQSGERIIFSTDITEKLNAPSIKGNLTTKDALEKLLTGTGLTVQSSKDSGYTVIRLPQAEAETMPEVKVSADASIPSELPKTYAGGQVATGGHLGFLGNTSVMDAPFNVTSYTSDLIENQQSRTIADVIDNDPSTRNLKSRGNDYDGFFMRGFLVNNTDVGFGGLYGIAPAQRTTLEGIERVEVIKGPNALLTGINPGGSVGGSINLVPKRASDAPLTRITTDVQTGGQAGAHVDIGRRFGDSNQFGVRYNGAYHDGDTAIDNNSDKTTVSTLALDYRGEDLRMTLDVGYQKMRTNGTKQHILLNAGLNVPAAPSGTINYGEPWAYVETEETYGMGRIEYDLNPNLTAYLAVGAKSYNFDSTAQIRYTLLNNQGDLSIRGRARTLYGEENVSAETGIRGIFETGAVKHKWNVGYASFSSTISSNQSGNILGFLTSNIYHPTYSPQPATVNIDNPESGTALNRSFALADVLSVLDERVQLTLAAREQNVRSTNVGAAGYDKSALTPALGLVVKPWKNISFYGNYIEGLSPGEIVDSSFDNGGQLLAPYKTKQYETGVKLDSGRVTTTLSLFQIEQPFSTKVGNTLTRNGEQRNRGVELNVYGEPLSGVRVLGGLMYLDAVMTQTEGSVDQGNVAIGQPRYKANIYSEYDMPWVQGLTLNAGAIYTASQYNDTANLQKLPGWTVFSIGARYTTTAIGKNVTLRAKVDNLFDKDYWLTSAFGLLNPGAPRTLMLSATIDL